ncbi:hypothetical protein V2J09_023126 [Rumex salicifolius]
MKLISISFLLVIVLLGLSKTGHAGNLRKNFYKTTCNGVEDAIKNFTWNLVANDATIPARLLRLQFHDCFLRGCDASILLDSTSSNSAEKSARASLTLAGFDTIDKIKTMVEGLCPGKVSCADILALSSRDAVSFQFKEDKWEVQTGRRDGTVSLASEVSANIPSPAAGFSTLLQSFKSKGLTLHDLVVLSGAHTIGVSHCGAFSRRLFNFTGNNDMDPSLNATYAATLKTQCATPSATTVVAMDPGSALNFDSHYYQILKLQQGLFVSDAALLTNKQSSNIVDELVDSSKFFTEFGQSMESMIEIGVLTGDQGEIRNKCTAVNS